MSIEIADPTTVKFVSLNQMMELVILSNIYPRETTQMAQDASTVIQAAERDLSDDKRVRKHAALVEQLDQDRIAVAEVIDPYRSVDEKHFMRRRGARVA